MTNIFDFAANIKSYCDYIIPLLIGLLIGIIFCWWYSCWEKTRILKTRKFGDWVCEYFDVIIPVSPFVVAFIFLFFGGKDVIIMGLFTVSAVCVAFFQERLRIRFSKPELTIQLVSDIGEKTPLKNGCVALYYHLLIKNRKLEYCLAKNVQCFIEKVWKKDKDTDKFEQLSLPHILVLRWAFTRNDDFRQFMDIKRPTLCDFGRLKTQFLTHGDGEISIGNPRVVFEPYTYQQPSQFKEWKLEYGKGGTIIYKVIACADYFSSKPTYIRVEWDGQWIKCVGKWMDSKNNPEKMKEHLKISQITENEFNREIGNIANSADD